MAEITRTFVHEKSTKNTEKYQEEDSTAEPKAMRNLYLERFVANGLNGDSIPRRIEVTVRAID